ncbi:MAG TPA: 2-C-methyl-D-erythritol 2,4-cyclodiphosphate synthase [Limnochordales bacterium]
MAAESGEMSGEVRVGLGFDIHPLVEGRPLRLGGVTIPFERGLAGHSDGDALLHALTDALLGGACLGDIGTLFPDTAPELEGADSRTLLREAYARVRERGFRVAFVDAVVIAEAPRIGPHREAMVAQIREALGEPDLAISIKGKRAEGLGDIGQRRAIACLVTATLRRVG